MYVASKERDVALFIEGGSTTFSVGFPGLGAVGSCGGSAAFSLTVTVSNGPPSLLSKITLSPSRTITMSQGLTERGAHISTLRMTSVAYIAAVPLDASWQNIQRRKLRGQVMRNRLSILVE